MEGARIHEYQQTIDQIRDELKNYDDLAQVGILHEIVDDTPYKTENYMKYIHDEYYIVNCKQELIDQCEKFYELKPDSSLGEVAFYEMITGRNSARDFENQPISYTAFSNLIYYCFGVKSIGRGAYNQRSFPFKFANSQGGLNYMDLYLFVNDVEGVEAGIYYYDYQNNRIAQMDHGNQRQKIAEINFQNEFTEYSNVMAVFVADLSRVVPKYYKRAYRMAHVDGGIASAYLQLIAQHLGLSSCIVAGYLEHIVEESLHLSKDDYPLITISFGHKSRKV